MKQPGVQHLLAQMLWLDFQRKALYMTARQTETGFQIYRQSRGNMASWLYHALITFGWFMAPLLHPKRFKELTLVKPRSFYHATVEGYWRPSQGPAEAFWAETWKSSQS